MKQELSAHLKMTYREAAAHLKGSARRKFMAGIVESLGRGGLSYCAVELGWDPKTIRKGRQELESGIDFADRPTNPGRKRIEEHLPNFLESIKAILESQSQTDATFQSERLYTRLSVREIRMQLIERYKYTDEQLPDNEVLRLRINELGYKLRAVKKNQPKKRSPRQMPSSTS